MKFELDEKRERDRVVVDHSLVWPLIQKFIRLGRPLPKHIHFVVPYAAIQWFENWTASQKKYVEEHLRNREVSDVLFEVSMEAEEKGRKGGSVLTVEELNRLLMQNLHRIYEDRRIWALFLADLTTSVANTLKRRNIDNPGDKPDVYYNVLLQVGLACVRGISTDRFENWNKLVKLASGEGKGKEITTLPDAGFTDGNATPHDVYVKCAADSVRPEMLPKRPVYLDTRDAYWDPHMSTLFKNQGMVVRDCAPRRDCAPDRRKRADIRQCRKARHSGAHMWQRSEAESKDRFNITYVTKDGHVPGGVAIDNCPAHNLFKGRVRDNGGDEGTCWLS